MQIRSKSGFTSTEMLLIVIVVIVTLALIVIPRLLQADRKAQEAAKVSAPIIEVASSAQIEQFGGYVRVPESKFDTTYPIIFVIRKDRCPAEPSEYIGSAVVKAMKVWNATEVSVSVNKDQHYGKDKRPYWEVIIHRLGP